MCGSFEVRFPDDQPSIYGALEQARAFASAERDKES